MRKLFTLFSSIFLFLLVQTNISAQTYCTAGANSCDEYIKAVSFGSINNNTGCGLNSNGVSGYSDYTAQSTLVQTNTSYSINVTNGNTAYSTDACDCYIDWNQDGDFLDADEHLGSKTGTGPYTISFTSPNTTTFGSTRLRIRIRYGGSHNSCGIQSWGEVEDYTVDVKPPAYMYYDTAFALNMGLVNGVDSAFISQNYVKLLQATVRTHNGSVDPIPIDSIKFQLTATDMADIKNVYIFHTNKTPLSILDTIGAPITPNSSGEFWFTPGPGATLGYGDNSVWIGVDIDPAAATGNIIDCKVLQAKVDDTIRYLTTNGNPAGYTTIVHPKDYFDYCAPKRTSTLNYTWGIRRVLFEGIDNQSATTTGMPCLFVYPSVIPTVYKQLTYPITVRHGELNNQSAAVWIDWNNDGYFDGTAERVLYWLSLSEGSISTGNITIPCTATAGIHRMRVVAYNGSMPPVCAQSGDGEYEEYFFIVPEQGAPTVTFTTPSTVYQGAFTKFYPETNIDGNISYIWDYNNDGIWDDTTAVGGHVFSTTGSATVKMKAELVACDSTVYTSNTATQTFTVTAPTGAPQVNFIANLNDVTLNIPVKLTDLTTEGPHTWEWEILPTQINGNQAYIIHDSYNDQNPTIEFLELGTYDVKLKATNIIGSNTLFKTEYITVHNENVICTDTMSTLASGYLYDDGGPNNNYTKVPLGLNNYQECGFVIQPKCADVITLDFLYFDMCSYGINTYCPGNKDYVRVYDGTDNTGTPLHQSFKDIFGNSLYPDGFTNGPGNILLPPPPSVAATSGSMYVEMFLNCGATGTGFEAKWSTQMIAAQKPTAAITGPTTSYTKKAVQFGSTSTGYLLDYAWDLDGDGYSDQYVENPIFTYNTAGTYIVRLIVNSCSEFDTTYHTIVISDPTNPPTVDFEANYVRVTTVDEVTLMDKSDATVYMWNWTISPSTYTLTNGTTTMSQNVKLMFGNTGYYTVKLVGTNAIGADSVEKTSYIYVYNSCKPGVGNLSPDLGFSEVLLQNIDANGDTIFINNSTIGNKGYTDYSKTIRVNLYKTGTYSLTMKRNTTFNNITRTAWIDFNMDGTFDDATEKVAFNSNAASLSYTGTFTIPSNAVEGLSILRVAANAGILVNKGCGPNYTGEFEDYGIIIKADDEKPVIELIGGDTVVLNSCGIYIEAGYTAWDDVSGDLTSMVTVSGVTSINNQVAKDYYVTYDVSDASGNDAETVTRVVTVLPDIVKPTITLNGNNPDYLHVNSGAYLDPGANRTDNCSGIKASGSSTFNTVDYTMVGSYMIGYVAEDNEGNIDTIYREVIVNDTVKPTIALIGNSTEYVDVKTTYTEQGVTITDNYYTNLSYTTTGTVNTKQIGTYVLSYCVTDPSGNGPVCIERIVVVEDNEAPEVVINGQTEYTIEVFEQFTEPMVTATDNYWSDNNIIITKSGSVDNLTLGDYTIDYTAVDASGNVSATKSIIVHVVDLTPPTIELVGPSLVTILRWHKYEEDGYKVHDNYDKTGITVEIGGTYVDGVSSQLVGLYVITYKAKDVSLNVSNEVTRFIYVDENISIDEEELSNGITYYPNPTQDELNIEMEFNSSIDISVSIYNSLGQHISNVYNGKVDSKTLKVDVSNLSGGVYFLRFTTESGDPLNKQFIIAR